MRIETRVTRHAPPVYAGATPSVSVSGNAETEADFVGRLSAELAAEIRRYRRWRWRAVFGRLLRFAVMVSLIVFVFNRNWSNLWWMLLVFGGSKITDARAAQRLRTAGTLARTNDRRAVNVLALAYRSGDSATRQVAADALVRLLPQMRASDAPLITDQGMHALIGILNRRSINLELVLAVLAALQQVGDARAIPAVEKMRVIPRPINAIATALDRWFGAGMGAQLRRATDAADECLTYLKQRVEQERLRSTLLRPAERPEDEAAVLVRPVAGPADQDPSVLVRPAEPTT